MNESMPLFGVIKPGIAYRRLQINDRVTFNDLSEVAFELQVGKTGGFLTALPFS